MAVQRVIDCGISETGVSWDVVVTLEGNTSQQVYSGSDWVYAVRLHQAILREVNSTPDKVATIDVQTVLTQSSFAS